MSKNISNKVSSHFSAFSEPYSRIRDRYESAAVQFIIKDSMHKNKDEIAVCDIGGGNGNLLSNIKKYANIKDLYNIEFTRSYFYNLSSDDIKPINGSISKLPIQDNSFDYVIVEDVLHHLIGNTRAHSKQNVVDALSEMQRVVKNGGYIIIDEEYNKYKIFSAALFHITKVLSKSSMQFKYFYIHKDVIVSFLSPLELTDMLINIDTIKIIDVNQERWDMKLRYKLTLLMSNVGKIIFVCKKINM